MNTFSITTRKGDDGSTSLLGDDRVAKSDKRPEAYGTLDEANALLGIVRSKVKLANLHADLLQIQNHIYLINAELACPPEKMQLLTQVLQAGHLEWLEHVITSLETELQLPRKFIIYGESEISAYLDLARAVVRRAERQVVLLHQAEPLQNHFLLAFINRLSDYLFVAARWYEKQNGLAFRHPELHEQIKK
jgi:cob(I)alamin adenosyltransferase